MRLLRLLRFPGRQGWRESLPHPSRMMQSCSLQGFTELDYGQAPQLLRGRKYTRRAAQAIAGGSNQPTRANGLCQRLNLEVRARLLA